MTLIIWDGKTLVSDRRVTSSNYTTDKVRYSEITKIHAFDDITWNDEDEKLLACGFTGNVAHYDKILAWLEKPVKGVSFYRGFRVRLEEQLQLPYFGMIFVTDVAAYRVTYKSADKNKKGPRWERWEHTEENIDLLMAVGSGEDFVYRLNKVFKGALNSRELLFLGTMGSKDLGAGFDKWELDKQKILKGHCLTDKRKSYLATLFTDFIFQHSINH